MLKLTGLAAVGTVCGKSLPAAEPENPIMQVGALIGVFSRPTFGARLDAAKANGLDCVQVAMDCLGLPFMPDEIPADRIDQFRREVAAHGVPVTAVQGTFNMCHPDAAERATGLRQLRVLAEACPRLGVSLIHICTGTRNRGSIWAGHPDNNTPEAWRDMLACVRQAAKIAEKSNVVLGFEPEVSNIVDSAKKSRRLMDEVGSAHLKVAIDGANLFHAGELARMDEVLDQSFELIGKDIVMAHAKDLIHDGEAGDLPAGHGKLDYDRYLSLLHKYGFRGPLLLHSLNEAQTPGCVKFLREKLAKLA